MYLKRLSLLNYKNISEAELKLSSGINCFIGNNGAGKTNFLDAIYYLCFCKSRFGETDLQNIRHGENIMILQGSFIRKDIEENIYCGVKKGSKKQFSRNKSNYKKLIDHIGLLPLVMISPEDGNLIIGGSDERRKFADSVISQYDKIYLNHLLRYNKLLSQRNRLLKNFEENNTDNTELLAVYDEQMTILATYIYNVRKKFCTQLIPIFQLYYEKIAEKKESVGLKYQSQLTDAPMGELLTKVLQKDRILQHTTVGIHRDELLLTIGDYFIKKEGSQGQKKTYLIALKLAQYEFIKDICGFKPILVMDDIFDKLDAQRVEQIIKIMANNDKFGQIFISDTNKENIEQVLKKTTSNYHLYLAKKGHIMRNET